MAGFPTFMRAQRNFPLWGKTINVRHYIEVLNMDQNAAFGENKIRCTEVVKCSKKRGEKI